jgi:copper resistance protein C
MKGSIFRASLATLMLALPTAASFAHTSVASTNPKSGSVLEASPAVIEIQFHEEARLTSVVVIEPGKAARKLAYTPTAAATLFKIPDAALGPGRSEIQWKALSKDGHVVSGSLVLVIKPSTAKTN